MNFTLVSISKRTTNLRNYSIKKLTFHLLFFIMENIKIAKIALFCIYIKTYHDKYFGVNLRNCPPSQIKLPSLKLQFTKSQVFFIYLYINKITTHDISICN